MIFIMYMLIYVWIFYRFSFMTYPRNSMIHKIYTLLLWFTISKLQVFVHNINIRMYIYRKKGSSSHLTYKRWRKNKCKVRVMVQMLRGSLHVPPRFKRLQSWLPRFTLRRGTLGDLFVPSQLLLVTIFSVMVRLCACNVLWLHGSLI